MSSLSTLHDGLLVAHYKKIIDDLELTLLYDANASKPLLTYSKFVRFDIDTWNESECRTELRFCKEGLDLLCRNSKRGNLFTKVCL